MFDNQGNQQQTGQTSGEGGGQKSSVLNESKQSSRSGWYDSLFFFQKYWHIVDKDIFLAVQQFFPSGRLLKSFNHALVSLIPKVSNAANIKQLRPISLCNVSYIIITSFLQSRSQANKARQRNFGEV